MDQIPHLGCSRIDALENFTVGEFLDAIGETRALWMVSSNPR
jgi:hypothetical protein